MPNGARFRQIDELLIGNHHHLEADDNCYFLIEYTSGKRYDYSAANDIISNLKKKPSTRDTGQWQYKLETMRAASRAFGEAISHEWLRTATLVPIPPSKALGHPEYDDRMRVICENLPVGFEVDVRDLVTQTESHEAAHESDRRLRPDELIAIYRIDEGITAPMPRAIGVVDDVLTVGAHYRAMHTVLSAHFPQVPIVGFFIARRVFAPD